MTKFTLSYKTSTEGIKRSRFDSWEAAKAAGEALNFDWITPNVERDQLIPRSHEIESGIFDDCGNRFADISRPRIKKDWE